MNPSSPLVTVCVPSYNYADLLRPCLESVLSQSFRDFELLVVDDASTDDSARVTESFNDPHVRVVRHARNVGAVQTWNHGLALARGEYVGFLCADDCFRPDKLKYQVATLQLYPQVALVHADGEWMNERGEKQEGQESSAAFRSVFPPEVRAYLETDHVVRPPLELPRLAAGYNYIHLSSALLRRRAAAEAGGFDPTLPYAADWDLWLRLAAHHGVAYLARPLTAIRLHNRNLTLKLQASGQAFRDWYGVVNRTLRDWPADAGPSASVRESALRVIREHLLAQVHAEYARGETWAVRRDLRLALRNDPRVWGDIRTLTTYAKAWLDVPGLKRWLMPGRKRDD
jgi:glycosyltransferase involved in cell wall biosynthesis